MKILLLVLAVTLSLTAKAQKLVATGEPVTYKVGSEKTFIYRTPADTAKKSRFFYYPGEEVEVVGEFSPRWVIIKRTGFLFITPAEKLVSYRPRRNSEGASPAASTAAPSSSSTGLGGYHSIQTGPRGGQYYINSHGNKTYVKHK